MFGIGAAPARWVAEYGCHVDTTHNAPIDRRQSAERLAATLVHAAIIRSADVVPSPPRRDGVRAPSTEGPSGLTQPNHFDDTRNMESNDAVAALAALAQATRLEIFRLLVRAGPAGLHVGAINEALDIAPATLSFHLKELARAGLIENRQEGRFIYCRANFAGMNDVLEFLTENCCESTGVACDTPRCAPARSPSTPKRRRPHEKVSRPSRRR